MKENVYTASAGKAALGNSVISWIFKPPKSNKFLYAFLAVMGGLIISLILYFDQLVPYLKRIPALAIYGLIFLLSPLLKYFSSLGRDQRWTLYENGYSVQMSGRGGTEERIGHWHDYDSCTYDKKGVRLVSNNPMRKSIRLPAIVNIMEIYSICRERISLAKAIKLDKSSSAPPPPRTREQRQLARAERKSRPAQPGGSFMEKLFPELNNQGSEGETS